MKTETTTMNAMIGYYGGDEWGSDGWWEEGADSVEIDENAHKVAKESGFDTAPDLVYVETAKLSELPDDEWSSLESQWRLSKRCGWTSKEVDAAIQAEFKRREDAWDAENL